jgi:hypothetical protein
LKELRLEQGQYEIDEKSQRHHRADDIEHGHGCLLQPIAESDEEPREQREPDHHAEIQDVRHHTASFSFAAVPVSLRVTSAPDR